MPSVRAAMAPAAAAFYGDPTASLQTVGVTGTNGKTTTAFLVRALLEADGRQTGLLGTVKSVIGGRERPVERTTPEAIDLQRTFREMLDGGDVACAMEVSSHALDLHRADAIHFAAAIFTNLTQDHLDFHGTMEEYFLAKRRLFADGAPAARRDQRRRPVRRAAGRGDPERDHVRGRERGHLPRERRRHRPDRVALHGARTRRRDRPAIAAARAVQRLQRARGARGGPRAGRFRRDGNEPPSRPPGAFRDGSSRSTPARSSPCWSITRTRRTRSRTYCAPPEAS